MSTKSYNGYMVHVKKIITTIFIISIIMCSIPMRYTFAAQKTPNYYDETRIANIAARIISWKKASCGISDNESLLDKGLVESAGTYNADWYAIGSKRLTADGENADYLAALYKKILINVNDSTSKTFKVTDIHRNILATIALGGDPTKIKNQSGSSEINLLSDFVYNRGLVTSLGSQGIPGWIWGLIALDSMQYNVPGGSYYSRDDLIVEILKQQTITNGFALTGTLSDPDMTAMAVQALSPYYNSEKTYTYIRTADKTTVTKTVGQIINEALTKLSSMQQDSGDYKSWGQSSAETGAQVALALCCLGIDPQKDVRFIKNGNTLLDGILLYSISDGGFSHTLPAIKSNSVSSEQILYTMSAILRQMKNMRKLYDFRQEQTTSTKSLISQFNNAVNTITEKTTKSELLAILAIYNSIVDNERMYVYNYSVLTNALIKSGISISDSTGGNFSQTESKKTSIENSSEDSIIQSDGGFSPSIQDNESTKESSDEYFSEKGDNSLSYSESGTNKQKHTVTTVVAIIFIILLLGFGLWYNFRRYNKKQGDIDS